MLTFEDLNGGRVELAFGKNQFAIPARHVLVIAKHENRWLMTKHKTRGIEFPGGKAEPGELTKDAAIRETFEETGVGLENPIQFAEYFVNNKELSFCKAVFTGEIKKIENNPVLYETLGAVWLTEEELLNCNQLSFHMKDTGMDVLREWVNELG